MSVSSVKTTVTTERPYLEIDRISVTCGVPAMARSTGMVTYCSASSGESAGAAVITWTWTLVTSGTASMGSLNAARMPATTKNKVAPRTMIRFRSDHATSAERSAISLLLGDGALEHEALQGEGAVHHHVFPFAQAREHLDLPQR